MIKEIKKRFIYIMILVITFVTITNSYYCVSVKANSVTQTIVDINNGVLTGYEKLLQYAGMLIDTGVAMNRATFNFVKERLVALGLISENATESDVKEFFDDNIVQDGNNVEYSENLNIYIKSEMSSIIADCGYTMCYSYSLIDNINNGLFNNAEHYNALRRLVSSKDQNSWIMYNYRTKQCFLIPYNDDIGFVRTQNFTAYEYATTYKYSTWEYNDVDLQVFDYDSTSHEYVSGNSIKQNSTGSAVSKTEHNIFGQYGAWVSNYKSQQILVYDTLATLKRYSVGAKPYYLSNKYNQYNSTTGSYNTNTDNSITYGDVYTYINNYYDENGEYPSQPIINIYIDNPVVDNPSGGTGGGSNSTGGSSNSTSNSTATATNGNVNVTVNNNPSITLGWPSLSGNGVSDNTVSGNTITGGVDNIFGFISYLGQVLGNLIKNVGNALVDLVEGIAEIIASIFEAIPNVFNDFMTGVFGWLPAELRALIVLAISAMLIVGIIKLIRG